MAKNLIEQFLDFATSKLTGPLGDDIYIKEESEVKTGLTGVARYLAKQEQAAQAAAAMTGVAKYLARQAQAAVAKPAAAEVIAAPSAEAEAAAAPSPAPMSRVARYLASQQAAVAKPAEAPAEAAPAPEAAPAAPLSRVAKYLASQAGAKPAVTEAAAAPVAQEPSVPMSRVAKYLASQQAAAKPAEAAPAPEAAPAAPLSRVAKYLASQAGAKPAAAEAPAQEPAAPLSRVAKYLASQQAASSAPAAAEVSPQSAAAAQEAASEESSAPLSRVAKYLAAVSKEFQPDVAQKSETVAQPQEEPAKRTGVSKYLASHNKAVAESSGIGAVAQVIKDLGKVEAPSEEIEISEDEAVGDSGNLIRLDDGKQCQASTAKGTQCKNKANLGHIQLAVNDQEYQFSVCTQHNNENFKPFAELLDA